MNLDLNLDYNPSLGEEGIISVGKLLTTYPNLEELLLILWGTNSKDEACVSVLKAISELPKLKILDLNLSYNECTFETLTSAEEIKKLQTLE